MEYEARPPASISIGGQVSGQNVAIGGTQTVHGDPSIAVGALPSSRSAVLLLVSVDLVRNAKSAARSRNTTG